ncbi:MAG: CU044_2847 family protein [Halobacteriota archaeon]
MAKKLVKYEVKKGQYVTIEVDDPNVGLQPAARSYADPEESEEKFREALAQVKPLTEAVIDTLKELGPKQYQLEFGLKLTGKAGIVIASGEIEANFKLTMTWGE